MWRIATVWGFLLLTAASPNAAANAAAPGVISRLCEGRAYEQALCAYYGGDYQGAEEKLRQVAEGEPSPEAIRARYFLARALMRQQKWELASRELITIFGLDAGFYREWGCDFLLGECRRELGLD